MRWKRPSQNLLVKSTQTQAAMLLNHFIRDGKKSPRKKYGLLKGLVHCLAHRTMRPEFLLTVQLTRFAYRNSIRSNQRIAAESHLPGTARCQVHKA